MPASDSRPRGTTPHIRYADFDAGSDTYGDGLSWGTAFKNIQVAIDALPITTISNTIPYMGGEVRFLGSHVLTAPITVPTGVRLRGNGRARSRIIVDPSSDGLVPTPQTGETGAQFFHFGGFRIQGPTTGNLIKIINGAKYSVRDLDMYGHADAGSVWLNGALEGSWDNVRIENNTTGPGLLVDWTGSTLGVTNTHTFTNCVFRINHQGLLARLPSAATSSSTPGGEMTFIGCDFEQNDKATTPDRKNVQLQGVAGYSFIGCHFEATSGTIDYNVSLELGGSGSALPCRLIQFNNCLWSRWDNNFDGDVMTIVRQPRGPVPAAGTWTISANSVSPIFEYAQGAGSQITFGGAGVPMFVQPPGIVDLVDG
jgi:hypothetical protein